MKQEDYEYFIRPRCLPPAPVKSITPYPLVLRNPRRWAGFSGSRNVVSPTWVGAGMYRWEQFTGDGEREEGRMVTVTEGVLWDAGSPGLVWSQSVTEMGVGN